MATRGGRRLLVAGIVATLLAAAGLVFYGHLEIEDPRHRAAVLGLGVLLFLGFGLLLRFVRVDARDEGERLIREERLRGLSTRMNEIELVLRPDGSIVEANDRAVSAYGHTRDELLRMRIHDLRAPATMPAIPEQIAQAASAEGARFETEHRRRDGTPFPVEVSARSFRVGEERFLHGIVRDLTERRRSEAMHRALARNFPNGVVTLFDRDLRLILVDGEGTAAYGRPPQDLEGKTIFELYGPEDLRRLEPAFRATFRGERTDLEERFGDTFREAHFRPILDEEGRVILGLATSQDVSARKRAERALREAHDTLRAHVEQTPLGVIEWDADYRVKGYSGRAEAIFGFAPGEVVGRLLTEIPWVPETEWPSLRKVMEDMRVGARPSNVSANRNLRKDGSVIHCEWHNSALYDETGKMTSVLSLVLDVTERERALAALAESRERLDLLVQHAPAAIALLDRDLRYLAASRRWRADYGLGDQEIVGRSHYEVFPDIPERWKAIHRRCLAGAIEKADEDPFPRADGGTDWVRWEIRPWRGAGGEIGGIVIFSEVVTEQRRMKEQLAVTARLAALGTLVHGLAHEINNPLAGEMSGQGLSMDLVREVSEELRRSGPSVPAPVLAKLGEVLEILADAQSAALRIARIVRELNVLGRPDMRREPVVLRGIVDEALGRIAPFAGRRATIEVRAGEASPVLASVGHLEQVVMGLVDNAARAIPDGRHGRVEIRIGPGPAGRVHLEVEDDGVGIAPDVLPRIFDPFFTTREVGQGRGLGLPTAHAIVAAHGGTLTVTSQPGKGTTFRIELPAAKC
ncbi:MAG: PAS domain S-box protein [Anaeromyxobacteraceae bacterium]